MYPPSSLSTLLLMIAAVTGSVWKCNTWKRKSGGHISNEVISNPCFPWDGLPLLPHLKSADIVEDVVVVDISNLINFLFIEIHTSGKPQIWLSFRIHYPISFSGLLFSIFYIPYPKIHQRSFIMEYGSRIPGCSLLGGSSWPPWSRHRSMSTSALSQCPAIAVLRCPLMWCLGQTGFGSRCVNVQCTNLNMYIWHC